MLQVQLRNKRLLDQRQLIAFALMMLGLTLSNFAPVQGEAGDDERADEIIFVSQRDGNAEIYLMDTSGNGVRNLTNSTANDYAPVWSPNEEYIVFVSGTLGVSVQLYVMNADGSDIRLLGESSVWYDLPIWSPDSNQIVVTSSHTPPYESDGSSEIYIIEINTGDIRNLTNNRVDDYSPQWRPYITLEEGID